MTWQVPAGVNNITVRVWGSGAGSVGGATGAYVQGVAFVTPGEALTLFTGGPRAGAACGYAGTGWDGDGGGYSALSRENVFTGGLEFIAVAGGAGSSWGSSGESGRGVPAGDCGQYAEDRQNDGGRPLCQTSDDCQFQPVGSG